MTYVNCLRDSCVGCAQSPWRRQASKQRSAPSRMLLAAQATEGQFRELKVVEAAKTSWQDRIQERTVEYFEYKIVS